MTLDEAAYNILNALVGGRTTHGELASLRQIKFQFLYWRATLIRREIERTGRTLEFEQTLGEVPIPFDEEKGLFISSVLPRVVRTKDFYGIVDVRNHLKEAIPIISYREAQHVSQARFTTLANRAYIDDSYLVVLNPTLKFGLQVPHPVVIKGVFEDVAEAHDFRVVSEAGSNFWDDATTEVPISMDIYQRIFEILTKNDTKLMVDTPNDRINDNATIRLEPS